MTRTTAVVMTGNRRVFDCTTQWDNFLECWAARLERPLCRSPKPNDRLLICRIRKDNEIFSTGFRNRRSLLPRRPGLAIVTMPSIVPFYKEKKKKKWTGD